MDGDTIQGGIKMGHTLNLEENKERLRPITARYEKTLSGILKKAVTVILSDSEVEIRTGSNRASVAGGRLAKLPGCCGVVVSFNAYVLPKYQNRGIGKLMNSLRIEIAKSLHFGVMLCTDIIENAPQQAILTNNGWNELTRFNNPKTNNTIAIHYIDLSKREDIPYSLTEAEEVFKTQKDKMDPYHWELFGWLIEEYKKLEEAREQLVHDAHKAHLESIGRVCLCAECADK